MRLLKYDENGEASLTPDLLAKDEIPPYAILSHTWGNDEATFEDLTTGTGNDKTGYDKIRFCMQQAAEDGFHHCWVDTCCINKADTTELQYAINSMFRWYKDAAVCYVFLSDVSVAKRRADSESSQFAWEPAFRDSRWFTRGWTLQELVAPRIVKFFSREGQLLGRVQDLMYLVQSVTKLPGAILNGAPLHTFPVDERLTWIKERKTKYEEDKAYSLLGIFDIFLPLIYGEGEANAFRRLRNEIEQRRYTNQASLVASEQDLDCLQSLSFPEQEQRQNDIHTAVETCDWLFEDSRYKTWMNSTQGLIWIRGNPGSGKSVLMKHAARRMGVHKSQDIIVSYFIHGQGTELQRTTLGLFRALLNFLLGHFPSHLAKLATVFKDREERFGGYWAGRWNWGCKELQEVLSSILTEGSQYQQIIIFIDALDEFGEAPARQLFTLLASLETQIKEKGSRVKICFSSRHYPALGFDKIPTIFVEQHNAKDIHWYVSDRLKEVQAFSKRTEVFEGILSKARGGFQWVFLITETLKSKRLAGFKAESLLRDLKSCPETLSETYATLLKGGTKAEECQMLKLFQWIMFAERPLSAQELREALASDARTCYKSISELRSQESYSDSLEDFESYVRYLSRGLVEFHTRDIWEQHELGGEEWNREAQLIHQSVADYLLDTDVANTGRISVGLGHFQISRSCLAYLNVEELLVGCRLPRGMLSSRFPLAPYAVRFVFEHIKKTEQAGVTQDDLLSVLKWSPCSESVRKIAQLWQTLNPGNIGTPSGWPYLGSSVFHVLAALGSKSALLASLQHQQVAVNQKDQDGNTPLHIALSEGNQDVGFALLRESLEWEQYYHKAIDHDHNISSVSRIQPALLFDLNAKNNEGETLLDIAMITEMHAVATSLIDLGANHRLMSNPDLIVYHAISKAEIALLKKLVAGGIDLVESLYFAAEHGSSDEVVLELVEELDSFDDPISTGRSWCTYTSVGKTLLEIVLLKRRYRLLATLFAHAKFFTPSAGLTYFFLDHATDDALRDLPPENTLQVGLDKVEHGFKNESGQSLMWLVAANGQEHVLKHLMTRTTADINAQDINSVSPLLAAIKGKQTAAVTCLLADARLDVNAKDSMGLSPLSEAIKRDYRDLVELLLMDPRLDINTKDEMGLSPLMVAASDGNTDIVSLLLKAPAVDVNACDFRGFSPLLAAILNEHSDVTQLLFKHPSINVHAESRSVRTPLSEAIIRDETKILRLLLAADQAKLEPRQAWSYLLASSIQSGKVDLVRYLLLTGRFNTNTLDSSIYAALCFAVVDRNVALVRLLLAHDHLDLELMVQHDNKPLPIAGRINYVEMLKYFLHTSPYHFSVVTSPAHDAKAQGIIDLLPASGGAKEATGLRPEQTSSILWWAAMQDDQTILKMLLFEGNVDVNATDATGEPLLVWACRTGNVAVVKLLLYTNKVDLHKLDQNSLGPLDHATRNGHSAIASMLIAGYGKTVNYSLRPTSEPAILEAVEI